MKCPYCNVEVNSDFTEIYIGYDSDGHWSVFKMTCPNVLCKKIIMKLANCNLIHKKNEKYYLDDSEEEMKFHLVKPLSSSRPPVPDEVDKAIAQIYREACLVFPFSQSASAALGRKCLQFILRDKAGVKHGNLSNEIQELLDKSQLPGYLADSIDAVRNIGNFASHPIKSNSTGEILPVETGEAEWTLYVIESLFDFFYVQPKKISERHEALNKKLQDAGKPPLK